MAKKKKQQRKQSNRCSLLNCEMRIVTQSDTWCKRKMPKGQIPVGDAPWEYIVTIPYCPNQNTFLDNVNGYIIRTKKHCGKLLLQVIKEEIIPDYTPDYGVKSAARMKPKANKKKLNRIISIKNLRKSNGKWGKSVH